MASVKWQESTCCIPVPSCPITFLDVISHQCLLATLSAELLTGCNCTLPDSTVIYLCRFTVRSQRLFPCTRLCTCAGGGGEVCVCVCMWPLLQPQAKYANYTNKYPNGREDVCT